MPGHDESARTSNSLANCPSGKSVARSAKSCPHLHTKRYLFFRNKNPCTVQAVPHSQEGRFAIVTNVGSGMRWTRRAARRTAHSRDGEVAWSRRPDAGVKFAGDASHHAGDGGKKARSPRRARRKPLKPLRRGCRTASASPVCSCAFLVSARAHETAGAARTRHSLRPPFSEGHELSKARAKFVARTRICVTLSSPAKAGDPVFQRRQ